MQSEQNFPSEEPKTPTKTKVNPIAEEIRFIFSQQKSRNQSFVEKILQDPKEDQFCLFSGYKQVHSNQEVDSRSYESQYSQSSQSQQIYTQKEKCQTVKKLFEPRLNNYEGQIMNTARKNTKGCNCGKSKCLKGYCVCYKVGDTCSSDCECIDCQNHTITAQHLKNQAKAYELLSSTKNIGCNCKNSGCLKNYCVCHQNGKKCTQACKCQQCCNMDGKYKDNFDDLKGARLVFTARKRVKISQFGYQDDKENRDMNK